MKVCSHMVNGRSQCRMPDGHYGMHNSSPLTSYLAPAAVSPRRRRETVTYRRLRREFLEARPRCEWPGGCAHPAGEVHHKRGRVGDLYLDVEHWLPLCGSHHAWATAHPAQAKDMGVSENRVGAP